ncbi:MAG: adhesin, partial [Gammaproteobacteria bacterium]|nr:adhesin [Gammaproteobacteria bacterium]NIR93994.1 adhesin [Gammaproteobacteria bacterium]
LLKNTATAGDEVMSGASGNIGLNMVSGDNNLQDNASAMTSLDAAALNTGLIDSEVFVRQTTTGNQTLNQGVENT